MNKRGTGVAFCFIGVILIISRYIAIAIFGSTHTGVNADIYNILYDGIGSGLTKLSIVFFILGIIYLVLAELFDTLKLFKKVTK